jgi:hypothetical protein
MTLVEKAFNVQNHLEIMLLVMLPAEVIRHVPV